MLINTYNNIFATKEWKYYEALSITEFPFSSIETAKEFITKYFESGEKLGVIDEKFNNLPLRQIHSISVFFLGFELKKLIPKIEEEFPKSFQYFWFMMCLYHDYGYCIEYNKEEYNPKSYNLQKLCDELNVTHIDLEPTNLYTQNIIESYFEYCRKEKCFLNHGIIGGILLYDRLVKNYYSNQSNKNTTKDTFTYKNLKWSKNDFKYYKNIALSIIYHNIWFADSKTDSIYKQYGLDDLCNAKLINYNGNELLFLLCLADTIEPIKYYDQFDYNCVLEKIEIYVDVTNKKIKIITLDFDYKEWFTKIKGLKKWLNVKVNSYRNVCYIKIIA